MGLGNWAVIDVETTGINPLDDEIIDLGFLQFEETRLVRRFSSLVRAQHPLSPFITKLTGITDEQLRRAPPWDQVVGELHELGGHHLIAHNSSFEEKFLQRHFERGQVENPTYQDSMLYLALLFPGAGQLNLESFIQRFGIADHEEHRGEADSRDLLKVMIAATLMTWEDRGQRLKLMEVFRALPDEFWFKHFLALTTGELHELAQALDFDSALAIAHWRREKNYAAKDAAYDPTGLPRRFAGDVVKAFLEDEASRQSQVPGYRARRPQVDMALRVGQAFKNDIHALIQAPTGTGKTLGYLLPAALFALDTRQPVLVATGTKTLQDQVMDKDLPQLRQFLQLPETEFKAVRLVGSNNHLCELLFRDEGHEQATLEEANLGGAFAKAYFDLLFFHNERSPYADKTTREQIPYVLKKIIPEIRERDESLAVDYRACVGQQCPFVQGCSYVQGLREAKEAQLIVGNHAMLLSWPRSFPRPEHVIVDEAHKIEGEATRAFALDLNSRSVEALLKVQGQGVGALLYLLQSQEDYPIRDEELASLREAAQFSARLARDHLAPLAQVVESFFKKSPNYHPVHSNEAPFPERDKAQDALAIQLLNHMESLANIWQDLHAKLMPHYERWNTKDLKDDKNRMKAWATFESFWGHLEKHVLNLTHFLKPPAGWVTVLQFAEENGWSVESAPVDVGLWLHKGLLESSKSVVYTSATLANSHGDAGTQGVEWMTGYSYLPQTRRFKTGMYLPPAFDYQSRAKVYLCTDTKPLYDTNFVPDLLKPIYETVEKMGGRTLFLFSARGRFELAVDLLLKRFEGHIPVFVQGMGKNVVEEFKKSPSGILVGMESFGEGIDVPGDRLQLIVIDKVPDVRQELVIQKRRDWYESSFGNEFADYFLAQRARALHQKCGRLLRREEDYGAVIIVDQRIKKWKSGTLRQFNKLMEPYQIQHVPLAQACSEVEAFLKRES